MDTGGEIRLGSALFTLVEPHRGHEVAYNRWYERDHFYAGCMVGPWLYAGRRWVATRAEKALRTGTRPDLFGSSEEHASPGTYLAIYFVIEGKHQEHFEWGLRQVQWLHANDRMFEHRDHVHTLLYDYESAVGRDDDGVPPELALDHPYDGLAVQVVHRAEGVEATDLVGWLAERRDGTPAIGQTLAFSAIPLAADAPVSQAATDDVGRRTLLLRFGDQGPAHAAGQAADQAAELAEAGLGEVLWSSPFRPPIPGTDTNTDHHW
jgi:hypothetical protein